LRAFAADQHAQAENELKTYRDAELEIIKVQDVLFDKEIKLAGDRFQQTLKLGNEKLQQEITVQKNFSKRRKLPSTPKASAKSALLRAAARKM
jgi:hypothetical protein